MKNKDIKNLLALITPLGWKVEVGRKHRHILNQNGQRIYAFSKTPSDVNFEKQTIRDLYRLKLIHKPEQGAVC